MLQMKKLIALITLLIASVPAGAQSNQASLTGVVKDASGAVIPDAMVAATNLATSLKVNSKSDKSGNYQIVDLPPAVYRVTFEHDGFRLLTQDSVTLVLNQKLELDATLQIGSATDAVTVTTAPSALTTTTGTLADLVPERSVEGLPLNVRDPFALVGLTPGVQFGGNFGTGGAPDIGRGFYRDDFYIGGGRSAYQEIEIDGAPNTTGDGLNIIDPPVDSILEFKVTPNSYDAQYGRSTGGLVTFATKSGSNQFHGVAYEFTRHSIFDANSFFNKRNGVKLPSFARNQFGGDLGGPLYRNRVFFFVDYEGLRQGYPNTAISTVPTALQRAGNFSQTYASNGTLIAIYDPSSSTTQRTQFPGNIIPTDRIDPVAAAVMNLYPLPNAAGNPITNQNNYIFSSKATQDTDKYDIRTDMNITEKTKMFARYSRQQDTRLSTGTLPLPIGGGRSITDHFTQALVDLNRTITQNVVADVGFSFGRSLGIQYGRSNGFDNSTLGWPSSLTSLLAPQFPVFNIGDITGTANGGDAIVNKQPRNIFSTLGVVYIQHGRHGFKVGGDIRNIHFNEGQNATPSGSYTFNRVYTQGPTPTTASTTTGYGLASFLLGAATSGSVNQLQRISTQGLYYGVYFQDDWKATDRLFLNLGVRWDVGIGDREKYNRLAYFDPNAPSPLAGPAGLPNLKGIVDWIGQGNPQDQTQTDWSNVGPRFGFAYKSNPQVVWRGGYGIIFHPRFVQGTNGGAIEAVRTTTMTATINNGVTPYNTLSNPFPQGLLPAVTDRNPLVNFGQTITAPVHEFRNGYSEIWSFGVQIEFPHGFVADLHYWGNHGLRLLNTYNIDQLPDQYLSLGSALNSQVPNPFYGTGATGALALPTISRQQSLLPFPQYTAVTQAYGPNSGSTYNAGTAEVDKRISKTLTLLANYTWAKALDDDRTPLDNYNRRAERSFSSFDIRNMAHISFVYSIPYGPNRLYGSHQNRVVSDLLGDWDLSAITNLQDGIPVGVSRPAVMAPGTDAKLSNPTVSKWFNTSLFSPAPAFTFGNVGPYLSDVKTQAMHNLDAVLSKNFEFAEASSHPITATFRWEVYNVTNTVQLGAPNNSVTSQSFGQVTSALNAPRDMQFALKLRF
jgi:Carboxypeptidase regulatory-like domain